MGRPAFIIGFAFAIAVVATIFGIYTIFRLAGKDYFKLHIIHLSNFHATIAEVDAYGQICKFPNQTNCQGGLPRIYSLITKFYQLFENVLVINGGNTNGGSVWYSAFGPNVTVHFMNKLPFDAFLVGNKDLEVGLEELTVFVKRLKFPVVVVNLASKKNVPVSDMILKSHIVYKSGYKIGIIGVIPESFQTFNPALDIVNEMKYINLEALRLVKREKVFTIILLSFCGLEHTKLLARHVGPKISVIIEGQSVMLHNDEKHCENCNIQGPYPTKVKRPDGTKILIVGTYPKYLGKLAVTYDESGRIIEYEGAPIQLNSQVEADPELSNEVRQWTNELLQIGIRVVGFTKTKLQSKYPLNEESTLGNVLADAVVHICKDYQAEIGLIENGSFQGEITEGNITVVNVFRVMPKRDTWVCGRIKGQYIHRALELGVINQNSSIFLHVSGIKYKINIKNNFGSAITSIELTNSTSKTLNYNMFYRIGVTSSIAVGDKTMKIISKHLQDVVKKGDSITNLSIYLKAVSPINMDIENRIVTVT